MLLSPYPDPLFGRLVRRYKRFFADVELDNGDIVTAHCPNTGPMTGVCVPEARVLLSRQNNPKRKLAYTWEAIELVDRSLSVAPPVWVGVNTSLPNRVVKALLGQVLAGRQNGNLSPELAALSQALGDYDTVRSEVKFGAASRVDFLLEGGAKPIYLEVKNTTWTEGDRALFPDTETTRGQKHLRELSDLLPQARAIAFYFIHRHDCTGFAPGDDRDPEYGRLLRAGRDRGLEILPVRFGVSSAGVSFLGLAHWAG